MYNLYIGLVTVMVIEECAVITSEAKQPQVLVKSYIIYTLIHFTIIIVLLLHGMILYCNE